MHATCRSKDLYATRIDEIQIRRESMPQSKSNSNRSSGHSRNTGNSQSQSSRSEAAKRGWETRRKNATKRG
jgi:hypothetical protein